MRNKQYAFDFNFVSARLGDPCPTTEKRESNIKDKANMSASDVRKNQLGVEKISGLKPVLLQKMFQKMKKKEKSTAIVATGAHVTAGRPAVMFLITPRHPWNKRVESGRHLFTDRPPKIGHDTEGNL